MPIQSSGLHPGSFERVRRVAARRDPVRLREPEPSSSGIGDDEPSAGRCSSGAGARGSSPRRGRQKARGANDARRRACREEARARVSTPRPRSVRRGVSRFGVFSGNWLARSGSLEPDGSVDAARWAENSEALSTAAKSHETKKKKTLPPGALVFRHDVEAPSPPRGAGRGVARRRRRRAARVVRPRRRGRRGRRRARCALEIRISRRHQRVRASSPASRAGPLGRALASRAPSRPRAARG